MSRRLDRQKREPAVIPYRGYFICRVGDRYLTKTDPKKPWTTIHHGGFSSVEAAKEGIDWHIEIGAAS